MLGVVVKVTAWAALLLTTTTFADTLDSACGRELDIGINVDQSGSVSPADFITSKAAVVAFIDDSSASNPGNRYNVLYYATGADGIPTVFPLGTNAGGAASSAVESAGRTGGVGNTDDEALMQAAAALSDESRPRIIIHLSDGGVELSSTQAAADAVKEQGITLVTVAIGVLIQRNIDTLEDLASLGPDGAPYFFESLDFDALRETLGEALIAICNDIPPVDENVEPPMDDDVDMPEVDEPPTTPGDDAPGVYGEVDPSGAAAAGDGDEYEDGNGGSLDETSVPSGEPGGDGGSGGAGGDAGGDDASDGGASDSGAGDDDEAPPTRVPAPVPPQPEADFCCSPASNRCRYPQCFERSCPIDFAGDPCSACCYNGSPPAPGSFGCPRSCASPSGFSGNGASSFGDV